MKHCDEHWARMRKAVDDRGMSHLVAGSGQEAVERVQREIEAHAEGDKPSPTDFDPLMAMNWNFCGRAMQTAGIVVMQEKDAYAYEVEAQYGIPRNDGHYCPLCLAKMGFLKHLRGDGGKCGEPGCEVVVKQDDRPWDEAWIEGCADAMHKHAVDIGLVRTN